MKKLTLLVISALVIFCACNKVTAPEVGNVVVGTKTLYAIEVSSVIYSDGNDAIKEKGFCYNVGWNSTPTYTNCQSVIPNESIGFTSFTSVIGGLHPQTQYTIVAYAINSADTTYSYPVLTSTLKTDGTEWY